jgi:FkbM family methyltransferase
MIKSHLKALVNSLLRPLDLEIVRTRRLPLRLFDFGEGEDSSLSSHFSLVLVGAHDGSKMKTFIRQAEAVGKVLLIEPVPFLFSKLESRYAKSPKVILSKIAISTKDGEFEFIAPKQTANLFVAHGDQLGSLVPNHAKLHDERMAQHIEVIKTPASSFTTLVRTENISSIHTLFTDTEGMDAELLQSFPFSAIIPKRIIFEFKHTDGANRVGKKLASLLTFLEDHGYRINVLDAENMIATHD